MTYEKDCFSFLKLPLQRRLGPFFPTAVTSRRCVQKANIWFKYEGSLMVAELKSDTDKSDSESRRSQCSGSYSITLVLRSRSAAAGELLPGLQVSHLSSLALPGSEANAQKKEIHNTANRSKQSFDILILKRDVLIHFKTV